VSAACGAAHNDDNGGNTAASTQKAAEAALGLLQETGIPRTVVAISFQVGQAPTTCSVLAKPGASGAFELFVEWKTSNPNSDYAALPQSVLEATIHEPSAKDDRFHVSSFASGEHESASVVANVVRALLSNSQQCEALQNGDLRLVSLPSSK